MQPSGGSRTLKRNAAKLPGRSTRLGSRRPSIGGSSRERVKSRIRSWPASTRGGTATLHWRTAVTPTEGVLVPRHPKGSRRLGAQRSLLLPLVHRPSRALGARRRNQSEGDAGGWTAARPYRPSRRKAQGRSYALPQQATGRAQLTDRRCSRRLPPLIKGWGAGPQRLARNLVPSPAARQRGLLRIGGRILPAHPA